MKYLIFLCPICLLNIFLSFQLFVFSALWSSQPFELPSFWSPSFLVLPTFFGPLHMCAVCVDFKDRVLRAGYLGSRQKHIFDEDAILCNIFLLFSLFFFFSNLKKYFHFPNMFFFCHSPFTNISLLFLPCSSYPPRPKI